MSDIPKDLEPSETVPSETVGSFLTALTIWAVSILVITTAWQFSPAARTLPLIVGIPFAVLATIDLGLVIRRIVRMRREDSEESSEPLQDHKPSDMDGEPLVGDSTLKASQPERPMLARSGVVWLLAYTLGIYVLGFTIATLVFLILFLRYFGREPWWRTLVISIGMTALIVVGSSDELAGIRLYPGIIQ